MEEGKADESATAAGDAGKAEPVKRPHDDSCDGDGNADDHKEERETRSPEKKKHKPNDGTAVSDVSTGGADKKAEENGDEYRPQCKKLSCCTLLIRLRKKSNALPFV